MVKLFGDSGGEREDESSPLLSELKPRLSGPALRGEGGKKKNPTAPGDPRCPSRAFATLAAPEGVLV